MQGWICESSMRDIEYPCWWELDEIHEIPLIISQFLLIRCDRRMLQMRDWLQDFLIGYTEMNDDKS